MERQNWTEEVTAVELIVFTLCILLMLALSFCALIPSIPAIPIVTAIPFLHRLIFKSHGAPGWILALIGVFCAVALLLDTLAGSYGAKKMGAGKLGIIGAIVGGIAGLFFGLPGIIAGPFVGALLFEMLGGRKMKESAKAGLGATLGIFAGALGKFAISLLITILFCVGVLKNSF
ncbi:MAG: putative rane protein [Verrucomicrobiales bacterium]|nr:putative rane protein [Verrucomicrobiales bacterium]